MVLRLAIGQVFLAVQLFVLSASSHLRSSTTNRLTRVANGRTEPASRTIPALSVASRTDASSPTHVGERRVCRLAGRCLFYEDDSDRNTSWRSLVKASSGSDVRTSLRENTENHIRNRSSLDLWPGLELDLDYAGGYAASAGAVSTVAGADESVAALTPASENLCMEGHIAPRFYLLGAQKSATTNFATKILWSGLSMVPPTPKPNDPPYYWKELHMFDNRSRAERVTRQGWLRYYPLCSSTTYAVGIDATPSYLSNEGAPKRLSSWYTPDLNKKLEFLVLLRQPFNRMKSSFYTAALHTDACKKNQYYCKTFGYYLAHALENYRNGCPSGKNFASSSELHACEAPDDIVEGMKGDPFHLSLYGPQLARWFSLFSAPQFVIAPFLTYVAPKKGVGSLVEFVASRLGSAVRGGPDGTGAIPKTSTNSGRKTQYPPLEESLKPLKTNDLYELTDALSTSSGPGPLASLLRPQMQEGLVLFGYKGDIGDEEAIAHWIKDNW